MTRFLKESDISHPRYQLHSHETKEMHRRIFIGNEIAQFVSTSVAINITEMITILPLSSGAFIAKF